MRRFLLKLTLGRVLAVLGLLSLLLVAAADQGRLVQLTFVNRSGYPLGIRMVGSNVSTYKNTYYLTVPSGDHNQPYEKTFELMRDYYTVSVTYIESYDPVYGLNCTATGSKYYLLKDSRLSFIACGKRPRYSGEPTMDKFNQRPRRHPIDQMFPPTNFTGGNSY